MPTVLSMFGLRTFCTLYSETFSGGYTEHGTKIFPKIFFNNSSCQTLRYIIIPSFYFVDAKIVHHYVTRCMISISEPHFPHKSVVNILSFCRPKFA